ncbi:hypothetical protein CN520_24485 [Bacillus cereus]|nr:hypothetical protein CN520_24485 [Bacillus cereus]PEY79238.1 hypothetical protein CN344_10480 [Bacillus cereus]PFW13012.1 hypothetical protein COL12_03055 [Bacillus cereus]PGP76301.1 hypothetical protein CN999_28130 [Bacillus cereus]
MEKKEWCIDSFTFNYKQQDYIVLVKLYEDGEKKPRYGLLKIEFLEKENFGNNLLVHANAVQLLVDVKTLREYFNISYSKNLGNILEQFNQLLSKHIPTEVIEGKSSIEQTAMIVSLSQSDSENPNKLYCYKVKSNPKRKDNSLGERSPFNDNKTRILRPELYEKLKSEKNFSFCYSKDPNDEKTNEEIINNWTNNNR